MPANCSADVQAVIAHIDEVFQGDNETAQTEIKEIFGYNASYSNYDVAGSRASLTGFDLSDTCD